MKFAKELEQELVPEWKAKYFDYKLGKKKLRALAIRDANRTHLNSRRRDINSLNVSQFGSSLPSFYNRPASVPGKDQEERRIGSRDASRILESEARREEAERKHGRLETPSLAARPSDNEEDTSKSINELRTQYQPRCSKRYGRIIGSPLHGDPFTGTRSPGELQLPDPAISLSRALPATGSVGSALPCSQGEQVSTDEVERMHHLTGLLDSSKLNHSGSIPQFSGCRPSPKRGRNKLQRQRPKRKLPNCSSSNSTNLWIPRSTSVHIDTFREMELRRSEFLAFLDEELAKIGAFYKQKEDEATHRLQVLKDQLHVLRAQRAEEVKLAKQDKLVQRRHGDQLSQDGFPHASGIQNSTGDAEGRKPLARIASLKGFVGSLNKATYGRARKFRKSRQIFETNDARRRPGQGRDNVKRQSSTEISYRTAKRKLEEAMAEYYRGLELLRSYAIMNRKAFQKINKKYNKMVNARPLGGYVSEKVNTTYFATRGVLDNHIQTVEDLYARYFERGNRKSAVGKLRAKPGKSTGYDASLFRSGLLIAAGVVFGINGLMHAMQLRSYPDPDLVVNTGYLLQIYGGYSLMLLLMTLFVFGCRVWSVNKINYAFVFEFPTRHYHNWRQLLELPSIFTFLLGFLMWMNFKRYGSDQLYLRYPIILAGVSVLILFFPYPTLYHQSRRWFLYSTRRLLLAGLYPVEFRDFFLGDMFCSLTYSLGNIELFFCLYAQTWKNPSQCNSTHSKLIGVFEALPGIWRALQCLRRLYDTHNMFPHLANCGKYTFTILYYVTLALYRLKNTTERKALFIAFATVNATYSSVWDLVIDWSLGDPYAQYPFLRNVLGLKAVWPYYLAMLLDPLLRFTWIFYAIYSHDLQNSALTSFVVALAEIFRRSLWVIFRIENEHCTNVGLFRASRDVALPYEIDSPPTALTQRSLDGNTFARSGPDTPLPASYLPTSPTRTIGSQAATEVTNTRDVATPATYPDLEAARTHEDSATSRQTGTTAVGRLRRPNLSRGIPYSNRPPTMHRLSRMGEHLSNAHSQDFERRNKLGVQKDEEDDQGREADESEEPENSEDKDSEEDIKGISKRMGAVYRSRSVEGERAGEVVGAAEPSRWSWI